MKRFLPLRLAQCSFPSIVVAFWCDRYRLSQQIKYMKQGHTRFGCEEVISESESVHVWVGKAREELRKGD